MRLPLLYLEIISARKHSQSIKIFKITFCNPDLEDGKSWSLTNKIEKSLEFEKTIIKIKNQIDGRKI